jgi:hypothetical protein
VGEREGEELQFIEQLTKPYFGAALGEFEDVRLMLGHDAAILAVSVHGSVRAAGTVTCSRCYHPARLEGAASKREQSPLTQRHAPACLRITGPRE